MPKGDDQRFQISISELDELLNVLKELIKGVKEAAKLSKKQREEMRESIGDTCELINSILTTVKQRISDVYKELRMGDIEAKDHILELANSSEWEDKYREFKLCLPLRTAASEIRDSILGRFIEKFSFKNPDGLKSTIEQFLRAEEAAGQFVAAILKDLSQLGHKVDSRKKYVMAKLIEARDSIQKYRDKFIFLEKKMRAAI